MSDQDRTDQTPYQRQTLHISQEPIDDIPTEYVMPERYTTVDRARAQQGTRRHMGVASSDPEYMSYTSGTGNETEEGQPPRKVKQPKTHASSFNYDRYLQTPTSGKSIFTSREMRRRRRVQRVFVICVAALIALLAVYLIAF